MTVMEIDSSKKCGTCLFYEESDESVFGGWCLAGVRLHDAKKTIYGVDKEDGCNDWEERHEQK